MPSSPTGFPPFGSTVPPNNSGGRSPTPRPSQDRPTKLGHTCRLCPRGPHSLCPRPHFSDSRPQALLPRPSSSVRSLERLVSPRDVHGHQARHNPDEDSDIIVATQRPGRLNSAEDAEYGLPDSATVEFPTELLSRGFGQVNREQSDHREPPERQLLGRIFRRARICRRSSSPLLSPDRPRRRPFLSSLRPRKAAPADNVPPATVLQNRHLKENWRAHGSRPRHRTTRLHW